MIQLIKKLRYKLKCTLEKRVYDQKLEELRNKILTFYKDKETVQNNEIKEALSYLKNNKIAVFPANFQKRYTPEQVEVLWDSKLQLYYVFHQYKRLYFKEDYSPQTIKLLYTTLLCEQDKQSPHCYQDEKFYLENGDILLDVGSAEGIFALSNIEKVKKVCLFEMDPLWIKALEATFEPWKDKVQIIQKFVSDNDGDKTITLNSFLTKEKIKPSFIKIDVEGEEQKVLDGMKEFLKQKTLKLALCTYHHQEDEQLFSQQLETLNFKYKKSKGVMIFINSPEPLEPPFFRKGVIRAQK